MLLTAAEVSRSLRGTLDLLNRRVEGLASFDMTEAGFWRSFGAIWLTLPAWVVSLALAHERLAPLAPDGELLNFSRLTLAVTAGHVASFLALPLAMIPVARGLGFERGYVPFVVVTNWIGAVGSTFLALPTVLLLVDWATPGLAALFTLAFAVVVLRVQWFATKATLQVPGRTAAAVVALGLVLDFGIGRTIDILAA